MPEDRRTLWLRDQHCQPDSPRHGLSGPGEQGGPGSAEGRRIDALGARLQSGLQHEVDRVGLPWTIDRLGGRIQFRLTPQAPRTGAESYASIVLPLADARKIFLLNRGIWDSIATAGPSVSYAITEADVDTYIDAAGEFLDELTR